VISCNALSQFDKTYYSLWREGAFDMPSYWPSSFEGARWEYYPSAREPGYRLMRNGKIIAKVWRYKGIGREAKRWKINDGDEQYKTAKAAMAVADERVNDDTD
jgi:hypothetical protein